MDLITHGLAGALLAQGAARSPEVRRAAVIGAIAGLLPDTDILIRAADDPLFSIEYHRHFTHALAMVPVGALLLMLLLWPWMRGHLSPGRVWRFALLGLLSSVLLDACTSFGTHLLWPFSDERIAWNLIAVVDPLFSLVLLVALVLAVRRNRVGAAWAGIGVALLYLALGLVQQARVTALLQELAAARGHEIERLEVKPTMGNNLLWRGLYQSDGRFHVDAVRVGWFGTQRIYTGDAIERVQPGDIQPVAPGSVLDADIRRFARLADDYLVRHPDRPEVLGDIRYAMLPNSIRPLWGIRVDPAQPDRHVEFLTLREMNPAVRREFTDMLLGR